jgi:hypothetical protein
LTRDYLMDGRTFASAATIWWWWVAEPEEPPLLWRYGLKRATKKGEENWRDGEGERWGKGGVETGLQKISRADRRAQMAHKRNSPSP